MLYYGWNQTLARTELNTAAARSAHCCRSDPASFDFGTAHPFSTWLHLQGEAATMQNSSCTLLVVHWRTGTGQHGDSSTLSKIDPGLVETSRRAPVDERNKKGSLQEADTLSRLCARVYFCRTLQRSAFLWRLPNEHTHVIHWCNLCNISETNWRLQEIRLMNWRYGAYIYIYIYIGADDSGRHVFY